MQPETDNEPKPEPTKQEEEASRPTPKISIVGVDQHGKPKEVTVDEASELGKMLQEAAKSIRGLCEEEHQKYGVFNMDGTPKSREALGKLVIERQWLQIQQWLQRDLGVRSLEWSLDGGNRTKIHQANLDRLANMGVFVTKYEEGKGYLFEFRPVDDGGEGGGTTTTTDPL